MRKCLTVSLFLLILGALALFADNPHTPRAPIAVASESFLNQAADLPPTTVFTPSSTGLYRLNLYEECTPQPTGPICTSQVTIGWTDDGRDKAAALQTGFMQQGESVVIYALAGTPITLYTSGTSFVTAGQTYNLFVTVEQL